MKPNDHPLEKEPTVMKMKVIIPILVVILLALLAALYFRLDALREVLGKAESAPAVTETPVTAETAAPTPEVTATPSPTPSPTPAPTPEPTPDMSELPEDWFDDAVFLGDSITSTLEHYCDVNGGLGDATFLCEPSCSVRNAVLENIEIWYQGKSYRADQAVPLTGATKVFIMLGTNDVAMDPKLDITMGRWKALVNMIRATTPGAVFFIESCLPMHRYGMSYRLNNDVIDAYNVRLREMCEEAGCVYVDIADYFKDEENSLADGYSHDQYVHLNFDGAALWAQVLRDPANYSVNPRSIEYGKAQ